MGNTVHLFSRETGIFCVFMLKPPREMGTQEIPSLMKSFPRQSLCFKL